MDVTRAEHINALPNGRTLLKQDAIKVMQGRAREDVLQQPTVLNNARDDRLSKLTDSL